MTRVPRALVVAATVTALAVTALAGPATARTEPDGRGHRGLQQRLDAIVADAGVGALVEVRDGRDVWRGTSGVAKRGSTRPVPVRGRFRAGSIGKTFLATVVLQLAARGRLGLDDPVERWLPGVVPDGGRITLRHLLDHTSGLYDVKRTLPLPPTPEFLANRWRTWTASELVERALAHPPTSEVPGETFAYTNTGYLLLAEVVEAVTDRPWDELVERRIIRRLGLRGTTLPGTSRWIPGPHPHGYVPVGPGEPGEGPRLLDYTEMNPSFLGAAGDLISTSRDLNRFFRALLAGRLLPERMLEEMRTPGTDARDYGLGLVWRDTPCGVRVSGNDGDALTHQAWSYTTEDRRRQVTVALTPDFTGDPDDAVDAFVDAVACR